MWQKKKKKNSENAEESIFLSLKVLLMDYVSMGVSWGNLFQNRKVRGPDNSKESIKKFNLSQQILGRNILIKFYINFLNNCLSFEVHN